MSQGFKPEIKLFLILGFVAVILSVGGILLFVLMNSEKEDLSIYPSITYVTEGPIDMQVGKAVLIVPNGTTVADREVSETQREIYNSRSSKGVIVGQDAQGRTFQIRPGEKMIIDIGSSSIDTLSDSSIELISDWQTYRNDEFGFEVKYPRGWHKEESIFETSPGREVFGVSFANKEESIRISGFSVFGVTIWPMEAISDKNEFDLTLCNPKAQKISEEQIILEGIPATKQRFEFSAFGTPEAYECIQLQKNDKAYEIMMRVIHESGLVFLDSQKENVLNEILSTFRFIDATNGSLKVLSPNGGEVLKTGETHEIIWEAYGIEEVYISLVSGGKEFGILAAIPAAQGRYEWTVPDMSGWKDSGLQPDNFKIFIHSNSATNDVRDYSDGTFTIIE